MAQISLPIENRYLTFEVHTNNLISPNFLETNNIDHLGNYINNLENAVTHLESDLETNVRKVKGYSTLNEIDICLVS